MATGASSTNATSCGLVAGRSEVFVASAVGSTGLSLTTVEGCKNIPFVAPPMTSIAVQCDAGHQQS